MSAERTAPMVELPPMGHQTEEQAAEKSLTHWVWTPYRDINNLMPWGIKSQLGYRRQAWTVLNRCVPYPLGNMTEEDVDRRAAEEAFSSGFSVNSAALPKVEYVKYAQDQARELVDSYGDEHGLRELRPFLGMDDTELVLNIFRTVQPFAYAIHEMAYEFTTGAAQRIAASNLSAVEQVKAHALAKIMQGGAVRAKVKASAEYEALISSMSDKSVGQPGISNPTPFHEWICEQLGEPVPARINRTPQQAAQPQSMDSGMVKVLMDRDAERQRELDALKTQVAAQGRKKRESKVEEAA